MNPKIPHLRIVVAFCGIAIAGYAILSGWAILGAGEAGLKGDIIGTWKSFAVLAFGFWLGSSSGGKATAGDIPADAGQAARQVADEADHAATVIEGQTT